ncbi:LysR family transcriptional regulator ArgP [Thalassotalea sp. 1_MG-2023]|uniref:LysR family transcriptional regulator ArgP n=1 Tax=Thalassotalea sp. 1_MG-2023 TaxID=3062680 RepID=UPI0026E35D4A|nr:LysR family transcriptional regulator ArgP [Thalassotalea sp. 1_MG-2023]MDO6427120.1 LysR family transcriptional regulator ArgP [Thalassotalea sp. 1_MG-2023]
MMDYQLLEALHAIVNEGGFEKAANKLFITQSAISRRIQTLESLLGEPVLIRSKPPKPTGKGIRLLNHFQQVLQLEMELNIESLADTAVSAMPITIRLATNRDSLATWLPEALSILNGLDQQQVKFELLVDDQSVVLNKMKSGEVMACISSEPNAINGGKVSYLGMLRYRAVASPTFLAKYKVVVVQDLIKCPCLIFDENDNLQHQFLADIVKGDTDFVHLLPCPEGFKQALIAGVGYGMLPELQCVDALAENKLITLGDEYFIDVPLYWHYWQSEAPQLKALRTQALAVASLRLHQPDK